MDSVRPLRDEPISGQFVPDLELYFSHNRYETLRVARAIVEQQFPMTVAPDVLLAVGLDPDAVLAEGVASAPANEARRRSSAWRHEILQAWDRCCAFCGFDGQMVGGPVGIEAAHVRWFNFGGPDDLDNGVALCSLHHKLLDRGVLGFMNPQTVMVSSIYTARSEEGKRLYDLHLRMLHPRRGTDLPHTAHVAWHQNEVFKGDPLGP
jgi:putative restriction endonuclease